MAIVGAREGVDRHQGEVSRDHRRPRAAAPPGIRVVPLPDVYPAGDEFILVHLVTGRIIPPGGLPKDVDTVVANVETLINIGLDQPVTHKYLTVAGAVAESRHGARSHRNHDRRSHRGCRRTDRCGFRRSSRRRDDGQPRRRASMFRSPRPPAASSFFPRRIPYCAATTRRGRTCKDRPLGLRPMPLLHRILSALSCSAIPSSRIAPCSRSGSRAAPTPWSPARSTAANAICARCSPALKISIRRTVCVQSKAVARERGLIFKGSPDIRAAASHGRLSPRTHAPPDRQTWPGRIQQHRPSRSNTTSLRDE